MFKYKNQIAKFTNKFGYGEYRFVIKREVFGFQNPEAPTASITNIQTSDRAERIKPERPVKS